MRGASGDGLWGQCIAALRALEGNDTELAEYCALAELIEAAIMQLSAYRTGATGWVAEGDYLPRATAAT